MSSKFAIIVLIGATALSGCMGGGGSTGSMSPTTPDVSNPRSTLDGSGQGNSGGVMSQDGATPLAGVEATMAYNGNSGRSSGANVQFHNGDMAGVGVNCDRAGGGAVVPTCATTNAQTAYLVNELSGVHSYAGTFAVEGFGTGGTQNATVAIHTSPSDQGRDRVQMPGGQSQYTGRFQAGGGVRDGGQMRNGVISGSVVLDVDFAQHSLDGTMTGDLYERDTDTYVPVTAGFTNGVVGVDGSIYNGDATEMNFAGREAWGQLDGAFYGPNAEEAAGAFAMGNDLGGMTGIFIGCSDHSAMNCVAPSPRF